MLREPTIENLHAMRLRILASIWLEQDKSPDVLARVDSNENEMDRRIHRFGTSLGTRTRRPVQNHRRNRLPQPGTQCAH